MNRTTTTPNHAFERTLGVMKIEQFFSLEPFDAQEVADDIRKRCPFVRVIGLGSRCLQLLQCGNDALVIADDPIFFDEFLHGFVLSVSLW